MLYGTSCCGKSAIIRGLIKNSDYSLINCYTTREARIDDIARISISIEQFELMNNEGYFDIVNSYLHHYYGNLREELETAVKSEEKIYVLDFLMKDYYKMEKHNHAKIIVLPENAQQLRMQISKANRLARENEILNDYFENYSPTKIEEYIKAGFKVVINKPNQLKQTIDKIDFLIRTWHSDRHGFEKIDK